MSKTTGATVNGTVNLPCAAEAIYEGQVYKIRSGLMTVTTANIDKAFAIAAQSTRDWQLNTSRILTSGDYWQFYMLGCNMIVNVQSIASAVWHLGDIVSLGGTSTNVETNGRVKEVTHDSSVVIGHYLGTVNKTISSTTQDVDSTEFIQVLLDTTSTEDTTA